MACSVHDSPHRRRLAADVRDRLFKPGAGQRIGAEVELIPLRSEDGAPVPIRDDGAGPGMLGVLEAVAGPPGWSTRAGPHGAPELVTPDGGILGFEPGGQIEYASPPCATVDDLVADLEAVVAPLVAAADDAGIRLLGTGLDPVNPLDRARLQLEGERYATMYRYLAGIGDAGPRMMLQSAAIQVNVELGGPGGPALRWRVLNAVAPYLTAIFASSPVYAGRDTGFASYRARQWRLCDRRRTGVLGLAPDPVAEYTDFALAAGWIFGPAGRPVEPFLESLLRGEVSLEDWRRHLTTLFPEVRPRGFLEVRGIDALPPRWYAAPLVLLAGLLADEQALREAEELVGAPDSTRLDTAARAGLRDPTIAGPAAELFGLALETADRAGVAQATLPTARAFFERYTARGRSPGDDEVSAAA